MYSNLSSTSQVIQSLPTAYPEEVRFEGVSKAPAIQREPVILRPQNNQYSTDSDSVIRFLLPCENMDLRRSHFNFRVRIQTTGPTTYKRIAQGAFSLINRVRVVIGRSEQDYQYYNRSMAHLWNTGVDADVESSIGQDKMGFGTAADRNAEGADPNGTIYTIPIRCGLLSCDVLPLLSLAGDSSTAKRRAVSQNQQAFVELTLEQGSQCIETDGTNPQFIVDDIQWNYIRLNSDIYQDSVYNKIASGSVRLGYRHWDVYQNSVQSASTDVQLIWKGSSLNGIHNILVDGQSINNPLIDDKFITWKKTLSLTSTVTKFQHLINNNWFPQEAINCQGYADRAYQQYLGWEGLWDNRMHMKFGAPIDVESFNDDQFIMIMDLQSCPRSVWSILTQDNIFNDVSTQNNNTNIIFRLDLSGTPPPFIVCYSFVCSNVVCQVGSDGTIYKLV